MINPIFFSIFLENVYYRILIEEKMLNNTITSSFKQGLVALDMFPNEEHTGLFFVSQINEEKIPHAVRFALEKAKELDATAVYFRFFPDHRPPLAQIYIYDETVTKRSEEKLAELHRKVWSSCTVRLVYVFTKTEVKIFNTSEPVTFRGKETQIATTPFEKLPLEKIISSTVEIQEKLNRFSAKTFDNGSFWENEPNKNSFTADKTAYEQLIKDLKYLLKNLETRLEDKISEDSAKVKLVIKKLLIHSILIKYLEERGVLKEGDVFKEYENADSFTELIRAGNFLSLIDKLASHFNGKIFLWGLPKKESELNEMTEEEKDEAILQRKILEKFKPEYLKELALFLDANVERKTLQYRIWRKYAFNYIPVELISNVYEEFLINEKGAVYTPPFLVNFLVDECMPINQPQENYTILDPACGSGVFLVAAFKRLIEWYRILQYQKKKEKKVFKNSSTRLKTIQNILVKYIFGVDINKDAAQLTVFSLSLALCDYFKPKVIWHDLKFDDLSKKNIIGEDFFDWIVKTDLQFDLVIGNPPFIKIGKKPFESLISKNQLQIDYNIPQYQVALFFQQQVMYLLKNKGTSCLIQPAGPLLYDKGAMSFRQDFFGRYNVSQVINLTYLRGFLFKAKIPTAVIISQKTYPNKLNIAHKIVRKTSKTESKIVIELDYYDALFISKEEAINEPFIWKTQLLGQERLVEIINHFSKQEKLGDFIENKKKDGWVYSEGFQIGNKSSEGAFLFEKPYIQTEGLKEGGLDEKYIDKITDKKFNSPRQEKLFTSPLLLIKGNIGEKNIPIHLELNRPFLGFKESIIGIHSTTNDVLDLKLIHEKLLKFNNLYRIFILCTSGKTLINRETVFQKKDLDNLPFPKNTKTLSLSSWEKIIINDALNYTYPYLKIKRNDTLTKNSSSSKILAFGSVFCKMLNTVYQEGDKKFQQGEIIETPSFICSSFYYGKDENIDIYKNDAETIEKLEMDLQILLKNESRNLRINKVLRIYGENITYLVKPKQLRYWLKSIAIQDADEMFNDLIDAGY